MSICYSIIINLYFSFLLIASIFNNKAALWINGRKNWKATILSRINKSESWIWFHCSSLGEFEDCCELFIKIKNDNPNKKTILTIFSPTAFEALGKSNLFDLITYLPLDTKFNAKTFLDIVKPELVLFSRSELWLHFIQEARRRNIPIFLISLKLNKNSTFIHWPYIYHFKKCLSLFTHIFCQNIETKDLLYSKFSYCNTSVTGNTRLERIYNQSQIAHDFNNIEHFLQGNYVIVIGSSLPKDEQIFQKTYNEVKSLNIKWILVPHEIAKSIYKKKTNSKHIISYSNIANLNDMHDVLIVDSVGILKYIYKYADLAIVGGGFNKIGVHNILEPSFFGVPTAFGPNHRNSDDAKQLMNFGGATIFRNHKELTNIIKNKFSMPTDFLLEEKIKSLVLDNRPNSSYIISKIQKYIQD